MLLGPAKWGAYRAADAFVLPSHQENFGVVVAEAQACGLPVLTTNKVNICDDIEAGGGGIVRNDDEAGVVDLLETWLGLPEFERRKMAQSARRLFEDKFSAHDVARRFLTLLSEHRVPGALEAANALISAPTVVPDVNGGESAA